MVPSNKPEWAITAEKQLFQRLTFHTQGEYTGSNCPVCGKGTDRLVVFEHGNYWCRRCGHKGWWREGQQSNPPVRKDKPLPQQLAWVPYREHPDAIEQWSKRGVTSQEVERWGLGYSDKPSLTIPVFHQGKLLDIRHRLLGDQTHGKYRSESNTGLFNVDSVLLDQSILVVEGEIKAIISSRVVKAVVGLPGVKFPMWDLLAFYHPSQTIVLALDPGTGSDERKIYKQLLGKGVDVRIAGFFDKPDDVLMEYGEDVFLEIIRQAE
jgi:hypothetical protein